jgi:general secretion pathway protein D
MMRRIDIMPVQVRIDATIAEVTLNDQLTYGTQFFFRNGGLNSLLSFANPLAGAALPTVTSAIAGSLPGFVLSSPTNGGASAAIAALQAVTRVNVLSSPQLLVMDNQTARMQVGNLVPYLSQTSQSSITAGAPVINSINYQPTGVILQITPRVSAEGMVTLDVSQEVSDVASQTTTAGITSPTFLARNVISRVAIQNGQTIGLAGLIRDSESRGNQGIPWLKDVPLLGLLAGEQSNTRTRTELIVLITPRVIQDQREALAMTQDLRDQLPRAAAVPARLRRLPPAGAADPGRRLRRELRLEP